MVSEKAIYPVRTHYNVNDVLAFKHSRVCSVDPVVAIAKRLRHCNDDKETLTNLTGWIAREDWRLWQSGSQNECFEAARSALAKALQAERIYFEPSSGDVIVQYSSGVFRANELSDDLRLVFNLFGDLAYRAITLNPYLGGRVFLGTPGTVTFDCMEKVPLPLLALNFPLIEWAGKGDKS